MSHLLKWNQWSHLHKSALKKWLHTPLPLELKLDTFITESYKEEAGVILHVSPIKLVLISNAKLTVY